MARRTKKTVEVDSIKHVSDTRKNIPTEELRDFVVQDEQSPATAAYTRELLLDQVMQRVEHQLEQQTDEQLQKLLNEVAVRNPDIDPQLVWKGKDEQYRSDLEVAAVPIYIQEKIHPHAIVEDVKAQARKQDQKSGQATLDLFADFNGIEFDQQIDFYQHDQKWQNRMILGDSLYVMTSLAEKEGLKGQVQMIYIDPPYGIKFGSNWQVSTRKRDVKDGKADNLTRQPEQVKAFRDTWKLGIHSYLAYLRDRLVVVRELLTDSGSVFVQIGDDNVHLVRCLLDEVFGGENFYAQINFRSMTALGQQGLANVYDYILWYTKDKNIAKFRPLYFNRSISDEPEFSYLSAKDGGYEKLKGEDLSSLTNEERQRIFKRSELRSSGFTPSCTYGFDLHGEHYKPSAGKSWRTHAEGMNRLITASRLIVLGQNPYFRQYHSDYPVMQFENSWHDTAAGFSETKTYVVQTHPKLIERCLLMTTDPGDLVLDPTCGSGTTAYVAEQWGRRWITTDTSRVALALARTRLMSAKYPYYILSDTPEGLKKEAEATGKPPVITGTSGDIKKGFVYKKVPHITLKVIANNPEIDGIHARWQEQLEPLRAKLNEMLGQSWEEWDVPRNSNDDWSMETKSALKQWWDLRQKRQQEIDASIARNSDTETLFDQPYEDNKKLRVTGPFTVESLSPHRVLSTDTERPQSETTAQDETATGDFTTIILENLRKAGVQNTIKNERLKFDSLEPYSGKWIQAEGHYTGEDGVARRAAISIGPEHGTVSPMQVKEAAKEAKRGIGFDILLVCGLSFDPHVSEEARRYGDLLVLPVRINPDLAMGGDLLKKTGSGNLFMIFGEPDLDIRRTKDGKIQIELKGLDIYDPTTGQIRSNSTKEIACWFIDTNYNDESFFVRHAYFTGGDKPYEKLKRALRAEVNEDAWAQLYSTKSRPFDAPETGKIAVKVINHYGDEVLKVFGV